MLPKSTKATMEASPQDFPMPPAPPKTRPTPEDSPQDFPTATLLECLFDWAKKQDDILALLTELFLKQQKQSATKDQYKPWGLLLPKASDIPHFQSPLRDADGILTHLQQLLWTNSLLTPSDDEEDLEEWGWVTVIKLGKFPRLCWVSQLGQTWWSLYGGGWNEHLARLVNCIQNESYTITKYQETCSAFLSKRFSQCLVKIWWCYHTLLQSSSWHSPLSPWPQDYWPLLCCLSQVSLPPPSQ